MMNRFLILIPVLLCSLACTSAPTGIQPVSDFKLQNYLGTWYEIARLDHSFERDLNNVTAQYSLKEDGGVSVINRGYNTRSGEWEEAEGRAYFVSDPETGHLKVSFFGPFYGAYVIFELDQKAYQYALVAGPNRDYLWLLARTPVIDSELKQKLIARARAKGFRTDDLIFPEHNKSNP